MILFDKGERGMVSQVTLTGMVLVAAPVGDYDKRLVILTKERGRITAFAKGARRPNSQYVAGSRPFSFGEFTLYQGREAYTLTGMSISNYFEEMSADLEKVYYGMYFLELAEYFSRENVEAKDMLNLLYASFRAIINGNIPLKLIKLIYEMKIFCINGEYPEVFECIGCEKEGNLTHFSLNKRGALCKECSCGQADAIALDTSTFYTLQYIVSNPINKLFSFNVSDKVLKELEMVLDRWISEHIDKNLNSLDMLKMM